MTEQEFREKKQAEVDANFDAIQELLKKREVPPETYGKYALMKDRHPMGYYSTAEDAYQAGALKYEDGLFSIQQVTTNVVDLGYFSHAIV